MKNVFKLFAVAVLVTGCASIAIAQDGGEGSARGLYEGYSPRPAAKAKKKPPVRIAARPSTKNKKPAARIAPVVETAVAPAGMPGTKVAIELRRNGVVSFVSPNYIFRSNDEIRLHLQINFQGYVTLVNVGTSGRVSRIYPASGYVREIYPAKNVLVPETNAWIKFDDTPGVELLAVILSSEPLGEPEDSYRSIGKGGSRDLKMSYDGDATYAVWPEEAISGTVGFTLKLTHHSSYNR